MGSDEVRDGVPLTNLGQPLFEGADATKRDLVDYLVAWDDLDRVAPADFTIRTAPRLIAGADPWAGQLPAPQRLSSDLIAEGHTIPVARVQAMHEGKRRARARRGSEGA